MSGILYVTGTPIGNLSDLSPRAVETLEKVDFIAAEDTRVTLKLLNHFGIKKPMVSYFEHNKRERGEIICARIEQGENCAIVTDAGMPCISDPGEDLVKLCEERGIKTVVIPGPSAVISALAVSGLSTGRFTFEGFLSVNKKSRSDHLKSLANEHRTMIFTKLRINCRRLCVICMQVLATENLQLCVRLQKFTRKLSVPQQKCGGKFKRRQC